ncbi:MAG: hypothetical protein AAF202_02570, partial [Pseudomonadota bacterium]
MRLSIQHGFTITASLAVFMSALFVVPSQCLAHRHRRPAVKRDCGYVDDVNYCFWKGDDKSSELI